MVAQGGGSLLSRLGDKKRTFLGQGSYGSVELVRYRKTGQLFAMKRLEKNSFANKMQRRSLLQEVEIHKRLVHDNIIRLYHSFEDETFIYLVRTEVKVDLRICFQRDSLPPYPEAQETHRRRCVLLLHPGLQRHLLLT